MQAVSQSPTDEGFVQDPYPFYDKIRPLGPLVFWDEFAMPVAADYPTVSALLRDRRFGREQPAELRIPPPDELQAFYKVETNSMLELEPPRHTRLRGLVLRAFTSRRIAELAPEIEALCHQLIDEMPDDSFDLLPTYAAKLPVIIIARLLGVPEAMADDLLTWSHAMVAMYQAGRTHADGIAAAQAASAFSDFLLGYVEARRAKPADDLITQLIAAEEDGERLSTDELIATCILLLNAGHEATVHTIGNATKTLLETGAKPTRDAGFVEESLRHDPPIHMFNRYALEDIDIFGHSFKRGDQVGLLLGAANRDPDVYQTPASFNANRTSAPAHTSFGAGLHFCVGAPLARLELTHALPILFERRPNLTLAEAPKYTNSFPFHGLDKLIVR